MARSIRSLICRNVGCYGRSGKLRLCLRRGDATCHSARCWCHGCRDRGCSRGTPPCAPVLYRESSSRRHRSCLSCLSYEATPIASCRFFFILSSLAATIYLVSFHFCETGPGHKPLSPRALMPSASLQSNTPVHADANDEDAALVG